MKRFLALVLCFTLLFGTFGCGKKEKTKEKPYHTDLSFSELSDSGIDASLEIARAKELLFRIEKGELSGIKAQKRLDERADALKKLRTDASIAYVRYCLDIGNDAEKRAYDTLLLQLYTLECVLVDAALLLSEDPALRDQYDEKTIETLLRADALSDPDIQPLMERERALEEKYELLSIDLTVEYKGKTWTGDEILSDPSLSVEDFMALYEMFMSRFNKEAGEVFLDLVEVRKEISRQLGFESYAQYSYACFDRDYSPSDAMTLARNVKETFTPMLSELRSDFYMAAGQLAGAVLEENTTMDCIENIVGDILPDLQEPWNYMLMHGMYDFGTETTRMPGSFTTYFSEYGTPFLFSAWSGGFDTPSTVIHEFGHFAAYYLNGETLERQNMLDLAEIDSQGLELLAVLRYDTLYGDLSTAAEIAQLFYALYTLLDGCMEDAFQQFAYRQDHLTVDALNAEYGRLCSEYGLDAIGLDERSWTQIAHTFVSPFYYISYTTSMLAALDLYLTARTDSRTARNAYRAILMRSGDTGFRETLLAAGLRDPFLPETIRKTAYELGSVCRSQKNK